MAKLRDPATSSGQRSPEPSSDWFVTTHWSVVRMAGGSATTVALEALGTLCSTYWPPLYAYIRRKGHDEHEAQDLTQEFFARLLARKDLAGLDPSRGKFRAFLLAAMNHFLANEWRKQGTLKRASGQPALSLDTATAEQLYASEAASMPAPESLYDRRWAEIVLDRAARQLREEFVGDGREPLFRAINVYLSVPSGAGEYAAVAQRLQMSEAAVAKAVERLRRRYRELVRREIAQTVSTQEEVEDEMRYLLKVLA